MLVLPLHFGSAVALTPLFGFAVCFMVCVRCGMGSCFVVAMAWLGRVRNWLLDLWAVVVSCGILILLLLLV